MRLQQRFTPQSVTVRDARPTGGLGGGHGPAYTIDDVWIVDQQTVIRDRDGAEVVSNTQVNINIDRHVPLGSLVTVWTGEPGERTATVEAVGTFRHDRLPSFFTLYLV